jgi:diguanylate cyclase (GGDEF)-like protein
MAKTHDFTKILWGNEFVIEAPIEGVQGTLTGEGHLTKGDRILVCVQCRVDEVEYYPNAPDVWQARVVFEEPVPLASTSDSPIQSIKNLISELGDALFQGDLYQRIEQIFSNDRTTQIANRGRFDSRLTEEWQRMRREKTPISVILCDCAGLAAYQEVHGERATDKCLQDIAKIIRACSKRPSDLVARYQDQMFAILLPNTPEAGANHVIEDIRSRLSALSIFSSNTKPAVSLRLGKATMLPDPNKDSQSLVQEAARSLT